MKIVLFESGTGGHRPTYLRRFAEALAPVSDVLLAVADETAAVLDDVPAEIISLGPSPLERPGKSARQLFAAELESFHLAAGRADHAIHLFADHLLRQLAFGPRAPSPTSLLVFYPRAHYPSEFGSRLSRSDQVVARTKDLVLGRWRRRRDASSVWSLDERAAEIWAGRPGATARWLPEPPVVGSPSSHGERRGCVLYGALTHYKGIDRLERAVAHDATGLRLTLAGYVERDFEHALTAHAAAIRKAGVDLDLRAHHHTEEAGLEVLSQARCVVIPYHRHAGMSRVLLEAAVARTPVVVHRFGLLGHLTKRHEIGVAVDADDPDALREAILGFTTSEARTASYEPALERFAARHSSDAFATALREPLGLASPAALESAR